MNETKVFEIANEVFKNEVEGIHEVQQLLNQEFAQAVYLLSKCSGKVIVMGIGKSGHIANKIAATMASTGTSAFFVHPTEALHGDLGMIGQNDVVIAISYSGESDELNAALAVIKRKDIAVIAITGNTKSTLAKLSKHVLNIAVTKEACPLGLAPTTSTTACLVLGDALAVCIYSLKGFKLEDFALSHPGGSLGRRLLIKVNDIMRCGERLPVVALNANLTDIVLEISNKGLGLTAVIDNLGKLVGVITDGDLRRILDNYNKFNTLTAQDIMNKSPKTLETNTLAIVAVELMEKNKINGFLIVDEQHKPIGAFNIHDLIAAKLL
ncbi:MAG: KpsF/GutQ family sugar-phosphate isomerase [Burkholderiales bacterium]|jgi:arabinose-5-phosphate isomerase|nr:KpsF/GutQ family sugar-phosphate isomerase [Burkholderiales bacterium]